MRTEEAVVAVSGGASGLGEATCRYLLERGARGVIALDRDEERGKELQAEIGDSYLFTPADVADEKEVDNAIALGLKEFGRIDVAVAAAAIGAPMKLISKRRPFSMSEFDRAIQINLYGAIHLLKAAAQAMLNNEPQNGERGLLVNVSSGAAFEGQIGQVAYSASKAAMVGITLPLARELGAHGIRVMTVAPGAFDTPIWSQVPAEVKTGLESLVPFPHRLGKPEEFASLIHELIRNPMHNGRTYRLDGGLTVPASSM